MSEMVERVAKAIIMGDYSGPWQDFIPEARAAIAAMREPTEPMLAAVADPRNEAQRECGRDDYRAMIDAALAEVADTTAR